MSRKLNVAVFGADGKLGKDLIELLSYEQDIKVKEFIESECDITNKKELQFALDDSSYTHVINCAAYTDVDGCEENEQKAFQVNAEGPKYLAEICFNNRIHLTQISTDYVFEGLKDEPYLEHDETIPLSVYGKSKLAGEGPVKAIGGKGLVIRTAWLYGKNGKNSLDSFLNKLELGSTIKIIDDQFGCPSYSMDIANAIIQLSLNDKSGVFHVVNSGSCSWYQFIKKAAEYLNYDQSKILPISYKELNRKAERPRSSILSMNKLERTLPESLRSWEKGLYQYLVEINKVI
jgi:dTDP-4-dehydrorhamnose reductase